MTTNATLRSLFFGSLLGSLLISCTKGQMPRRQMEGDGQGLASHSWIKSAITTLKVVDSAGNPIGGAQILIGNALDQPFTENFLATSANGEFHAPAGWTSPQAVTLSAPGYVRATYLMQTPNGQSFVLRPSPAAQTLNLKGVTNGFKVKNHDGWVDFGIVIPSITRQGFINFDLSSFISAETDEISVIGNSFNIPKNISLPRQEESYFFNIEFDKPAYQLGFRGPGPQMVFVARGQFPLDDVVNEVRGGKEFHELTNYFRIQGGSLRPLDIQQDMTLDLPVNELNFTATRDVRGPQIQKDHVVLTAALATWRGWYYPTDVKMLESNKARKLSTAASGQPYLLSILKRKDEMTLNGNMDRLSANFISFDPGVAPSFLPLMEKPKVQDASHFSVAPVQAPAGIFTGAQFAVLSKVSTQSVGGKNLDVLENIWEVYSPEWMANTEVPQWPGEKALTGRLRWEVTLTGLPSQNAVQNVELGPRWLDAASHATRSSQDF